MRFPPATRRPNKGLRQKAAKSASDAGGRAIDDAYRRVDEATNDGNVGGGRGCLSGRGTQGRGDRECEDAGENRKLNRSVSTFGMTLLAPTPACTLEIWKLVGGKYSLP